MTEDKQMNTQAQAARAARAEEVENTSAAWGAKLLALATEARGDSQQRDTDSALGMYLDDLSRVLTSYAARLGVELLPEATEETAPIAEDELLGGPESGEPLAVHIPDGSSAGPEPTRIEFAPPFDPSVIHEMIGVLANRIGALESAPAAEAADLPGWIRATLQEHHDRITSLEEALAQYAAALDNAVERIAAWLENNIGLDTVTLASSFIETPHNPDDYNPDAWGSIERARAALSTQVHRAHARQARLRQSVLNAVMNLTDAPDLSDDDRAQLAQHKARADRLDQIDVIRDSKLDEIAALDDLDAAKAYRADEGWQK